MLQLPPPDHRDAPAATYPAPLTLFMTSHEQRPMAIKPGIHRVKQANATGMTTRVMGPLLLKKTKRLRVPVVSTQYWNPRTFEWFPLAGQRHAIDVRDRHVPLGAPMRCLCGGHHPPSPDGGIERL
jgi:hypothetical protein